MKKVLGIILIIILIGLLFGCTNSRDYDSPEKVNTEGVQTNNTNTQTDIEPQINEENTPTPVYSIGDTLTDGTLNITLNSVDFESEVSDNQFVPTPKEGNIFAIVDVTYENISDDKEISYNIFDFGKMYDEDGYGYDLDMMTTSAIDQGIGSGELGPGRKLRGKAVFEVPEDSDSLEFEMSFGLFGDSAIFKAK